MGFDILNCSFCRVLSVVTWGSQLTFKIVFAYCIDEDLGDFIVQPKEVCFETFLQEPMVRFLVLGGY